MPADNGQIYFRDTLSSLPWPRNGKSGAVKRYFVPIINNGTEFYVRNVEATIGLIFVNNKIFPIVVDRAEMNSHVGSLYGHYITSAAEEARKFSNVFQRIFAEWSVKRLAGPALRPLFLNTIQLANWLVTTNLQDDITKEDITAILGSLCKAYPQKAIIVRSLNRYTDNDLIERLIQGKFNLIASRQVYIWDYRQPQKLSIKARNALRRDDRLAAKGGYAWRDLERNNPSEVQRILELYRLLYLEKYSWHNPQYTEHFVNEFCSRADPHAFLQLKVLVKDGRIDGFIGFYIREGVMTAPFVGYDTGIPQKTGLYRMLMARIRQEALTGCLILNGSAGAGDFKRSRGGISVTEYMAVYTRHLSIARRLPWTFFRRIMNSVGRKILSTDIL